MNPDLVIRDKEQQTLHGALRRRKRDVAQRVPQRAQKGSEIGSDGGKAAKGHPSNAATSRQHIEALNAGLQKVSAEIELSKTGTQTALNNQ